MMSTIAPPRVEAKPPLPAAPPKRPSRKKSVLRLIPYFLIAPAILFELLIHLIPMLTGITISFFGLVQRYLANWSEAPFVGLDNYARAVDTASSVGRELLHSFLITLGYTVLTVGLSWTLGIAGAVALQRAFRGRGFLRAFFLVPYALPVFAGVITWSFMFQRDNGLVNAVTGMDTFWLTGDNAFWAMLAAHVWRTWPFAFLMLMAALQSVPNDVYEAAALDGASSWVQFSKITLGMLAPVNKVLFTTMFLWSFNDFATPFVMFGALPPDSADLVAIHIYGSSFVNWNFGLGSAMSTMVLLFLAGMTFLIGKTMNKVSSDA